jgi:DNA-binding transcriptional regulator/RsmH inhibitor MraZ
MPENGPKSHDVDEPDEESDNLWFIQIPDDKLVIRLQAVVKGAVPWLAELKSPGSLECASLVGSLGQIVIRPAGQAPAAWKQVAKKLDKKPAEFGDERRAWFEIARLRTVSNLVKVSLEPGGRVSIYLSTVLADANVGPARGEDAVIISIGQVLEVWRRDTWEKWLLKTGENAESIEKASLQAIGRRSE